MGLKIKRRVFLGFWNQKEGGVVLKSNFIDFLLPTVFTISWQEVVILFTTSKCENEGHSLLFFCLFRD